MVGVVLERYNRQALITGWDQDKLKKSSVAIVGADLLGQYTIIPLLALGVGSIRVIGSNKINAHFLDFETKTDCFLEKIAQTVNPDVDLIQTRSTLTNSSSSYFLKDVDVVVDATNDNVSKLVSADYCLSNNIPFFSVGCNEYFGRVMMPKTIDGRVLMYDLSGSEQGEITSVVLGGIVAEEVKKVIMADAANLLSVPLYYNRANKDKFSFERCQLNAGQKDFGQYKVLMVGAGALGNFVGLGLSKLGIGRIDIIDDDAVEETNLNRQILFYDSVGNEKAKVLAKKLKKIAQVSSTPLVERFDKDISFKCKYDAIFDCVDSFEARVVINDFAIKHKIPLISGGTSYDAGQVAVYLPGKTSSIDGVLNLRALAKKTANTRRTGCIHAPNPSVIMTNQIIGGIMVGEAYNLFAQFYDHIVNGVIKYGANLETRIGINKLDDVV